MWVNIIIVAILLVIIFALFSGLFTLMRDDSRSTRTVRALSWRIGLSIGLFILLVVLKLTGVIEGNPDPLTPPPTEQRP